MVANFKMTKEFERKNKGQIRKFKIFHWWMNHKFYKIRSKSNKNFNLILLQMKKIFP
jgi:hypothetical protein